MSRSVVRETTDWLIGAHNNNLQNVIQTDWNNQKLLLVVFAFGNGYSVSAADAIKIQPTNGLQLYHFYGVELDGRRANGGACECDCDGEKREQFKWQIR